MRFETIPANESEDNLTYERGSVEVPERVGGPLKRNQLLTSELGAKEAVPILDRLKVLYKINLFTVERPLNAKAAAPAEYRIQIMDPNEPNTPASEDYVQYVFNTLKGARVPVEKGTGDEGGNTGSEAT